MMFGMVILIWGVLVILFGIFVALFIGLFIWEAVHEWRKGDDDKYK